MNYQNINLKLPKMRMSRTAITTCTRNWLAKFGPTRPTLVRLIMLTGAIAGVIACEEPKEIGLPPTTPVDVFYTDTISVQRSTILLDSTRSYLSKNFLVGRYSDPTFGKIQATAYSQLSLGGITFEPKDGSTAIPAEQLVYDSTRLYVTVSYVYGDTLQSQELRVHRLTQPLSTTINYDINTSIPYESEPIARRTITPQPNTTRQVSFTVSDAFGRDLLSIANKDAAKTNAAFQEQFRGLAITSQSATNAALLGFEAIDANSIAFVRLFYHKTGATTSSTQDFLLSGARFNQIKADRTGTPLANLGPQQALRPSAVGGRTFIQTATGVTTKLQFPGLDNLKQQGRIAINRADLIITPKAPPSGLYYLPPFLALGEVNAQNRLIRTTPNQFLQLVQAPQVLFDRIESSWTAPQVAQYDSRTKSYTVQLSGYFQSIIAGLTPNNGLAIITPGLSSLSPVNSQGGLSFAQYYYVNDQVTQAVLDGDASAKLIVFYTVSR
ncbi:hypothetical protein BN8_04630 [Fibrisoma limi BUZ 3]|uniref:DUF4270 domain-containing protein n=2 Tax=Fibrisoma limi TaxID=663275 RepID=I2GN98_9BACT|nr:hypothetical protein BN8_04630 [Fibrisoma limi BUZ 3]